MATEAAAASLAGNPHRHTRGRHELEAGTSRSLITRGDRLDTGEQGDAREELVADRLEIAPNALRRLVVDASLLLRRGQRSKDGVARDLGLRLDPLGQVVNPGVVPFGRTDRAREESGTGLRAEEHLRCRAPVRPRRVDR